MHDVLGLLEAAGHQPEHAQQALLLELEEVSKACSYGDALAHTRGDPVRIPRATGHFERVDVTRS